MLRQMWSSNAYWEKLDILLPELPENMGWKLVVDTWESKVSAPKAAGSKFEIGPRSVKVFGAAVKKGRG